jgi:hypothetical protein
LYEYGARSLSHKENVMSEATITIPIDTATAEKYQRASEAERRKIQLLVQVMLQGTTASPVQSLQQLMDDMSAEAQARGLTPEILEQILHDDA